MLKVAVMMGSASDLPVMQPAVDVLAELKVSVEVRVLSAHRTPAQAMAFAAGARAAGFGAIICAAGGAAHLAGVVAAHTLLPVIAVPMNRSLGGLDSLLAMVQMPSGVPVATVGIDGAQNAGLLAAQIIAVADPVLEAALVARRAEQERKVLASDAEVTKKASRP
jgi:5-(carboxyamino)imidazole ribonucleotide mutase